MVKKYDWKPHLGAKSSDFKFYFIGNFIGK